MYKLQCDKNGYKIYLNKFIFFKSFSFKEKETLDEEDDLHYSEIEENSLNDMKLLWHGEVEAKLDAANPLLCTMIYDSCR